MGIVGIGGFFFRANDPEQLADWYRRHLGVGAADGDHWRQEPGITVFMPFPRGSDYFDPDREWMLNFRVTGLDALIDRLRADDIAIITDPEWDTAETGRFARIHDPEGNAIELWEPPGELT